MTTISVSPTLQLSLFSSLDFYIMNLIIKESMHTSEPKCTKVSANLDYLPFQQQKCLNHALRYGSYQQPSAHLTSHRPVQMEEAVSLATPEM